MILQGCREIEFTFLFAGLLQEPATQGLLASKPLKEESEAIRKIRRWFQFYLVKIPGEIYKFVAMAKKKFYALKGPEGVKIVNTWEECEKLTHGVKGVLFKSFGTREEAEVWATGIAAPVPEGMRVYVDGSFSPGFPKAGWGFVVVDGDTELARGSGITAFDAESRNIDGEVMASFQAMKWLDAHDKNAVICHDYEGIARWAKGEWQAKSSIAQQYVRAIQPYLHRVHFEKVAAHTGVKWNEVVDGLAKGAIAHAKEELEKARAQKKMENIFEQAEKASEKYDG